MRSPFVIFLAISAHQLIACNAAESEFSSLRTLYKSLEKCSQHQEVAVCLKLKAIRIMDRALVQDDPLPLTDYVAIAKDPTADLSQTVTNETETEITERLPRSYDEKSSTLDEMLQDRISKYLETRTLQLSIPSTVLEGRGKKKDKGGHMWMGALAMGSMMIQMAMGKIALIAGKALLVGKIALLLSAIIGLKKLVGGGGGGGESHPQVIYAHTSDHGGWGRSLSTPPAVPDDETAHTMAYRAHVQ